MAFGTSGQTFPFSTKHYSPKHARKHSALSGTKLPGQVKATGLQRGRKSSQQRSQAPLLPHQPLLLPSPCHPSTLAPSPAIGSRHLPGSTPLGQAEGAFRKAQHAAGLISVLFTTILYYYLFIHSYFYFTLNMPSCVILVLLKM